jgi:hypothetical protein
VWPTLYREVCLGAVDDSCFEAAEIEPVFLSPEEARQVAHALLTSADEVDISSSPMTKGDVTACDPEGEKRCARHTDDL